MLQARPGLVLFHGLQVRPGDPAAHCGAVGAALAVSLYLPPPTIHLLDDDEFVSLAERQAAVVRRCELLAGVEAGHLCHGRLATGYRLCVLFFYLLHIIDHILQKISRRHPRRVPIELIANEKRSVPPPVVVGLVEQHDVSAGEIEHLTAIAGVKLVVRDVRLCPLGRCTHFVQQSGRDHLQVFEALEARRRPALRSQRWEDRGVDSFGLDHRKQVLKPADVPSFR